MNRLFHNKCSATRQDCQKKNPGAEFRKFDIRHEGPARGKTAARIRRGLEAIAAAPLAASCASGQLMDPKSNWFSYKVVGIILAVVLVGAIIQYAVENHIQKKQKKEQKG